MSLSQTQIIQSLSEALSWFEKELSWGVQPAELNHLTGRIGELYAAMITRGQMALKVNQPGYDVISAENERISVKTITSSTHVTFRVSTFSAVDRVMVLRVNITEGEVSIEEILDSEVNQAQLVMRKTSKGWIYTPGREKKAVRADSELAKVQWAEFGAIRVTQYENSSITVEVNEVEQKPAKPELRKIAQEMGVDLLNGNRNYKNTRQLGADVLKAMRAR